MRMDERHCVTIVSLAFILAWAIPAAAQTDSPPPPEQSGTQAERATQSSDSSAQTKTPRDRRPAYTSTTDLSDVRPFAAWIEDAVTTEGVDVEPRLSWAKGGAANRLLVEALAAVWVMEGLEAGGILGFSSVSPDVGSSQTDFNDVTLYGRYVFRQQPNFAAGAKFDLPVGSDNIGQGTFDFSLFGAYRQTLDNGMGVHANAAFESLQFQVPGGKNRESGLRVGGGVIIPMTTEIAALAELNIGTADDTFLLIGGVDWELPPGGHLRGGLSLNVDDGSEDFRLFVSFSIPVY